jgi:phospholipid-binding lipoprotein MlaA
MKQKYLAPASLRGVLLFLALTVFSFSGTAVAVDFLNDESYENGEAARVADPLEPFNRAVFTFNDKLYIWVIEPVATGYSKVLPADIRGCVGNFFYNLGEPVRSVNSLLQGRVRDSGLAVSRFAINSIFGVFGLADPASDEFSIAKINATLGETLSVWGLGDGFYLVVPLFGPSTLRDFGGSLGDSLALATYTPWNDDVLTSASVQGAKTVNRTSLHLGEYEDIKSMSFDPYVAFRNGYFQMRSETRNHSNSNN